jgi:hypothetical protein
VPKNVLAMSIEDLEIRPYRPGDEAQILATFNLVFREVCGPSYVDRSMATWLWQYRDNPEGHRIWLAVAGDGTVAAQYAGVPLRVDTPHGEEVFVHCVDSMTHPEWRQGLKRKGLFVLTCEPFWDDSKRRGDALFYGFPVDAAFRIGQRYLQYTQMCVIDYMIRDLGADAIAKPTGIEVECVREVPKDVDALYAEVRKDKKCLMRRDRRYLDWRYVQNPARADYELWAARRAGRLVGFMVFKPDSGLAPEACTIADWLVPEADLDAQQALLAAAVQRQRDKGRQRLMTVVPDWSFERRRLEGLGFQHTPSANWMQRRLVHNINRPPITAPFLAQNWWFQLGDSDLA